METDRIQELLQQADEKAGDPSLTANLADRTYQIYAQRRRITVALSTAAGLILVAGIIYLGRGLLFSHQPSESQPIIAVNPEESKQYAQGEIEQLRVEVAQLRAEAEVRTAILAEVLKRQEQQDRIRTLERQVRGQSDPLAEVNRLIERAALVTVYQADRKYNELDLKESAIADYRQVIKLYPETRWAERARQRLTEIETKENPSEQGDVL
jgi:hypothetical protein